MKVLALTGGIGSGKSTARQWFEAHDIATLDADQMARELVAKNQPGLVEIVKAFGESILTHSGELDRSKLRQQVFSDTQKKETLEAILHPMIRDTTEARLGTLREQGEAMAVVEIPLLAETGRPDYIDAVLVMDCSPQTQLQRTQTRSGLSEEEVLAIMQQQASRTERRELADYVIDSEQSLDAMQEALKKVVQKFLTKTE